MVKRVVLFDVDGVLVDSLAAHLQVCADLSRAYGLNIRIPTPEEFRSMARSGRGISPMKEFFRAVGFPEDRLDDADSYYQENFSKKYAISPFPGIAQMLGRLHTNGVLMGLATANVRANVEKAVGASWRFFEPRYCYTYDDARKLTKAEALRDVASELAIRPEEILFIGDQLGDFQAAQEAGTRFLGVTWGWAIAEGDSAFPTVNEPSAIGDYVLV
jgi:phosphoglycolate phosphatase-like HAD superfamily hydrolase